MAKAVRNLIVVCAAALGVAACNTPSERVGGAAVGAVAGAAVAGPGGVRGRRRRGRGGGSDRRAHHGHSAQALLLAARPPLLLQALSGPLSGGRHRRAGRAAARLCASGPARRGRRRSTHRFRARRGRTSRRHCATGFWRRRGRRPEVARALRPKGHRERAGERPLTIGGHDRRFRAAARDRVALAAAMFVDETRTAARVVTRARRGRADQELHFAVLGNAEQSESEPAAQIAEPRVALATLAARRQARRQPDLVAGGGAVDALQHEFQVEREFQFADDHQRRAVRAERDDIAAADLPLDEEAEGLEESLDRKIERGLQRRPPWIVEGRGVGGEPDRSGRRPPGGLFEFDRTAEEAAEPGLTAMRRRTRLRRPSAGAPRSFDRRPARRPAVA